MRRAIPECGERAAHLAGMARHIDDGVEPLAGQRRETVRLVALHTDEASAVRNLARDAACGARDVMADRPGTDGNRAAEKLRSAEDQQPHAVSPARHSSGCARIQSA